MKPWEMILAHRYSEAALIYEGQLRTNPDDPDLLAAHATAMMALGNFSEALSGFIRANRGEGRRTNGESEPYLDKIGSILWILGRRGEAIATFQSGVDGVSSGRIKFGDNAGGVSHGLLMWYAGVSTSDQRAIDYSLRYLQDLATESRIRSWPGSLAVFLLEQKEPEELLLGVCQTADLQEAINSAKPDLLKRRRLARALFYMAGKKRSLGNEAKCRELMNTCADLENPVLEVEWYLARSEIQQPPAQNCRAEP